MSFLPSKFFNGFHSTSRIKKEKSIMICKALIPNIPPLCLYSLSLLLLPKFCLSIKFYFLFEAWQTRETHTVHGTQPHSSNSPVAGMLSIFTLFFPSATCKLLPWDLGVFRSLVYHV